MIQEQEHRLMTYTLRAVVIAFVVVVVAFIVGIGLLLAAAVTNNASLVESTSFWGAVVSLVLTVTVVCGGAYWGRRISKVDEEATRRNPAPARLEALHESDIQINEDASRRQENTPRVEGAAAHRQNNEEEAETEEEAGEENPTRAPRYSMSPRYYARTAHDKVEKALGQDIAKHISMAYAPQKAGLIDIRGTVPSEEMKQSVHTIVESIEGVTQVANSLYVDPESFRYAELAGDLEDLEIVDFIYEPRNEDQNQR